jgi:pyroglutamyl-peptidase
MVTGFEPFGGYTTNPSALIADALQGAAIGNFAVRSGVLPVVRGESGRRAIALTERHHPAAIVCFGQGSPRQVAIRLERVAMNVRDFSIPDNAGQQPSGEPIVPGAPAAYFATWPVLAIRDRVRGAGVPCRLSSSAGTFLCNEVFYTVLRYLSVRSPALPAGFVHVPLLPDQVARLDRPGPSMALETMLAGARAALAAIVDTLTDKNGGLFAPAGGRGIRKSHQTGASLADTPATR